MGTVMNRSRLGYRIWASAAHLIPQKGTSSLDLHIALKIQKKSAWHMARKFHAAFFNDPSLIMPSPYRPRRAELVADISINARPDDLARALGRRDFSA